MVSAKNKTDSIAGFYGDYSNYRAWKRWDGLFTFTDEQKGYFEGEFAGIDLSGARVLEVGFGSGACLAWLAAKGAEVYGSEVNQELANFAVGIGVPILSADLKKESSLFFEYFDIVVAFDVFEHLTWREISEYLVSFSAMIKNGGFLILRFPNSQSPFGFKSQCGDPTHVSMLSRDAIEFMLIGTDFVVADYKASFAYAGTRVKTRMARRLRKYVQRSITKLLNWVYATNIPYEPVVTLKIKKVVRSASRDVCNE